MANNSEDAANPLPLREKSGFFKRIKNALARRKLDEESAQIIESLESDESISIGKREMLFKVASFDKLTIGEVMVPRADIIALEVNTSLGDLARAFSEHQHSRIPLYRDNLDTPVGFVHVKDVLSLLTPDENGNVAADFSAKLLNKLKRELLFVPASMRLNNLLLQMRAKRCHMALVIDEYGGTDGLVTIEDLVEEIIGDIDDEYDDDSETLFVQKSASVWEVDAKLELEAFTEKTGIDLTHDDIETEIDTLGGLAFALAGHVPPRGEIITHPNGYELEILDADPRKIRRILFRILQQFTPTENE